MRRLAKLFDFTGYGYDDDGWCVSVSDIVLNHHCRANTMLHRARLITEIHIINMFHNLLARLDAQFLPLIHAMEEIVANEGTNYATYKPESKKTIAAVASTAVSIKAILDTPILSADGALTDESEVVGEKITLRLTN